MTKARASWLLAAVVMAAGCTGMVRGQGAGGAASTAPEAGAPIVLKKADRPSYLTLDPFTGSFGMTGLFQATSSHNGGTTTRGDETLFTQQLTLGTGGTVVSPNLMTWTARGTLSLEEEWSHEPQGSHSQYGVFDTYNLQASLLNATQFPITAFARKSEGFTQRSFAPLLRNAESDYGATFRYNSPSMPTSLTLEHTTQEQSDLGGELQYSTTQDRLDFDTSFTPPALLPTLDRHQVSLNYSFSDVSQNNPGQLQSNSQSQSLSISDSCAIDTAGVWTLSQGFGYSEETGHFPTRGMYAAERLHFRPSETFEANLHYRTNKQEDATSQSTMQTISADATHKLFESLVTNARFGLNTTDTDFLTTGGRTSSKNFFADVGLDYRKKVWMGRMGAQLSLGYNQVDNSAVGEPQQVLNDFRSFPDSDLILLTRQGLDENSIAVFSGDGTRQYLEGTDYTVERAGNSVRITRVPTGNIGSNDTVRLNYLLDPLPGYTAQTTTLTAGANYAFEEGPLKGLTLYTRYLQADQSVSPSSSGVRPDNIRDLLVGAQYDFWKMTLRAEDERRDSSLAPYDSIRLSARYTDRLDERTMLTLDATQNFIHFGELRGGSGTSGGGDLALTSIGGRLSYQISRDLRTALTVRWRNQDDSRGGSSMGFEEQGELQWKVRQVDLYMLLRHTAMEARNASSDSFMFQFGLTRNF